MYYDVHVQVCPDIILEVQGDRKIRGFLKELYSWLGKNKAKYLKLILYVILMRSLAYYFLKQIS